MPAVVIGDQRECGVTHLGFTRELGLLQVCHADDAHAPAAVNLRLCFSRKRRPFHTQISTAPMRLNISNFARLLEHVAQFLANRMGKSYVRHDSFAEES